LPIKASSTRVVANDVPTTVGTNFHKLQGTLASQWTLCVSACL
jgi:hypothetical protein